MKKFRFTAGWRRVTVYAVDLESAKAKAVYELDKRICKSGGEAPVAYALKLYTGVTK